MFFHSEKSPAIFRWAMDPKKIRPVVTKHRVHLTESFQKFWSVFFFFNWVLFSIWFNLKLESTENYESNFLFFLNTSRRMCVDSVDREWPFTSLPRKSCPFARTHGPFSREHYPLLGTYFPLLFLSSLGRKKKLRWHNESKLCFDFSFMP